MRGGRRGILGAVAGPFALMGRALGGGESAAPGGSIADQWVEFLLKQVHDERSNSTLYSLPEDSPSDPPSSLSPALHDDSMAPRRTNSAELEETPHSMNLDELPGGGGRSGPISDPGWHHSLAAPLPTSLDHLNPGSVGMGAGAGVVSGMGWVWAGRLLLVVWSGVNGEEQGPPVPLVRQAQGCCLSATAPLALGLVLVDGARGRG